MARSSKPAPQDPLRRDITAVALATCGALILVSLLLSARADAPFVRYVAEGLLLAFGYGAYVVAGACLILAVYYALERAQLADTRVLVGTGLLFLVAVALLHVPRVGAEGAFEPPMLKSGGGYVGAGLAWVLQRVLGTAGSYVVILGTVITAVLLITQVTSREWHARANAWWQARQDRRPPARPRRKPAGRGQPQPRGSSPRNGKRPRSAAEDDEPRVDLRENETPPAKSRPPRNSRAASEPPQEAEPGEQALPRREAAPPGAQGHPAAPPAAPEALTLPLGTTETKREPGSFRLPSLDMLERLEDGVSSQDAEEEVSERVITLEDTLDSFGIAARVTHYERGPVLTRYEVEPERGIRVNRITSLADDLAMSLAAVDVRVEAPIPGKSAIGIEVPNERRAMVSLRGVMEAAEFQRHPRENLPLALGRDIAGAPVVADLVSMPHLLIAGATGSGKSVCLHSVILSVIMRHTPEEVRLILIDPKRVEMAVYDGIPHLISPVVHSVTQAASVLRKAIKEMEKRYDKFALKGVVNLSEYNDLARLEKESPLDEFDPLPRVVIVIDELADLMMQARAEFEYCICRLAQLARATGIHLVVATQRPSVKVITGNIKANMPSRLALAVASIHDSRTILDGQGAERLIGNGDMLYAPLEAPKPRRIQGSFVPREDIAQVAEWLRDQGEPEFEIIPEEAEEGEDWAGEMEESDDLYAAAVQYVVQEQMASVSMVQRRFKVGYARAGRLIDLMERRGVIGPHEGSRPRQVLIGPGHLPQGLSREPLEEAYDLDDEPYAEAEPQAEDDQDE